ncbi:hypothetical protein C9985_01315 [Marinobacter vinifirmus]|nr:hypothetical protein C9985_01315 [Marinobacter vinifirmus]
MDGMVLNTSSGKLISGITVHYGQASADITSPQSKGRIDTDSYGAGTTLTWYGAKGFYSDAQAQATWLDSRLYSSTLGRNLSDGNDAFGYATSLEIGQRIAIGGDWVLTPQGQLTYSDVNVDTFTDPFGATVSLEDGESLRGRLGLAAENRAQWEAPNGSISRLTSYGIANLYQEFMADSSVNLSGVALNSTGEDVWGGIGAGASYDWNNDQYSIYGEVTTNTGLANFGDSFNVAGTVGLRMLW